MLTSIDSIACILTDSDYVDVFISPITTAEIDPVFGICKGDSVQLNASGGIVYQWLSSYNISDTLIPNPIVWPEIPTTYSVVVGDTCGYDTISVFVDILPPLGTVMPDAAICRGNSTELNAYNGISYLWSPDSTLNNNNIPNPTASPYYTATYDVSIVDINNCRIDTFLTLYVDTVLPQAIAAGDTLLCYGDSTEISVTGGRFYLWSPSTYLNNPTDSVTIASPEDTILYTVASSNGCGVAYDNVLIDVYKIDAEIIEDQKICIGEEVYLWVNGGETYWWEPHQYVSNPSSNFVSATINNPVTFTVEITEVVSSDLTCAQVLPVFVDTLISPHVNLTGNIYAEWGDEVTLEPNVTGYDYLWSPSEGLSCVT